MKPKKIALIQVFEKMFSRVFILANAAIHGRAIKSAYTGLLPPGEENKDCEICCEVLDDGDRKPEKLNCGHVICAKCVQKIGKKECPFCDREKALFAQVCAPVVRQSETSTVPQCLPAPLPEIRRQKY